MNTLLPELWKEIQEENKRPKANKLPSHLLYGAGLVKGAELALSYKANEEPATWNDVNVKMPETIGSYLCLTNDDLYVVCYVNQVGWWRIAINGYHGSDMGKSFIRDSKSVEREVTHWMPLPIIQH